MKNNKNGHNEDGAMVCTCCSHYGGGNGSWARGAVLRIAIALFVSLIIFWVGVKVGELKSEICGCNFGRNHSYFMIRGYGSGMPMGTPITPGTGLVPQGGTAPTSTTGGPNVY